MSTPGPRPPAATRGDEAPLGDDPLCAARSVAPARLDDVGAWQLAAARPDLLADEAPLEVVVEDLSYAVLLRTPGRDADLVAGFLLAEGLLDGPDDLVAVAPCRDERGEPRPDRVRVRLAPSARRPGAEHRPRTSTGACGLCGTPTLARVTRPLEPLPARRVLTPEQVAALPEFLRAAQPGFAATGGLHGALLCGPDGAVLDAAEDVGRHNAVDKVIGACLRRDRWPLDEHVLVVSSRAGFEIVQKALVARISALVVLGAASTLAHDVAARGNLALYSFAGGGRFNAHGPTR